jgi:zinc protease
LGNVGEDVIDEIRKWSSHLSAKKSTPLKQEIQSKTGRTEIEKKDAIQTAIRIGRTCVDKKHPDYFGLQILDTILGGYFGSRLMANIREDKGYTYGIGSAFAVLDDASYFFISTEVAKEVKENTIKEIYFELDRLKTDLIPEDELERVKNYMLGEFLRQMDGPGAMMESFKNIWFNQLSEDYYLRFIRAITHASAGELRDLAIKYFERDKMVEVVVG